jgi:hypothetical protein
MLTIAADPKHLGARIGITTVLHTGDSALTHHPHVHMIVPGGGIARRGFLPWRFSDAGRPCPRHHPSAAGIRKASHQATLSEIIRSTLGRRCIAHVIVTPTAFLEIDYQFDFGWEFDREIAGPCPFSAA